MKRYSQYKDSGIEWIGEIPEHWGVTRFKYKVFFKNGYAFKSNLYEEEGVPIIRIGDISENFQLKNTKKVPIEIYESTKEFEVKNGDVLLALTGATIGKSSMFKENYPALLNQRVALIRNKNKVYQKFIFYLINTHAFREYVYLHCDGGAQENIGTSEVGEFSIPDIPNRDLSSLVKYLDTKTAQIGHLIQLKERKIELLKEKRQALINETVTKGLDPSVPMKDSGVEWIGEIPEHWGIYPLKYIIRNLKSGVSVNSEDSPVTSNEEIGVLKTSCVYGDEFRPSENKRVITSEYDRVKCKVIGDNIIISRMNTPQLVGSNAYIDNTYHNLFLPDRLWITEFHENIDLSVKWLSYFLKSDKFRTTLSSRATGTSPSMKNITKDDFLTMPIPFYQLNEQHKIANYLDEYISEIESLLHLEQNKIDLLKEYRQSLISEVVTGKIRVCEEDVSTHQTQNV